MSDVKEQLGTLIGDATRDGRLVIFVDDLDRCESARALEVCRVATQLLAREGIVTILLADMSPIAGAAAMRFAGDDSEGDRVAERADDIGRRYLEKIAQLGLMLPPPDPAHMSQIGADYGKALREPTPAAERPGRPPDDLRPRWRVIRGVHRAAWWPFLVGFVSVLLFISEDENVDDGMLGDFAILLLFAGFVIGVWSTALRLRARARRTGLKQHIE